MRLRNCLLLAVAAAAVLATQGKWAQAQQQLAGAQSPVTEPALHTKAAAPRVVVAVSARDKKGNLLKSLAKADLTLTEDGRAQTILSVEQATAAPLRLGVVVDTSREMAGQLETARKAAAKFVDQMLPAGAKEGDASDQVFVMHYDRQVELLEDFTTEHAKLDRELEEMTPTRSGRDENAGPETADEDRGERAGGRASRGGGATLYDAIYLAGDELFKTAPGRHVLVILSDGVDRGSKESLNEALDAAERVQVTLYTIYLKGEQNRGEELGGPGQQQRRGGLGGNWPGSGGGRPSSAPSGGESKKKSSEDGKKTLERLATRSGGRTYEAKKKEALDEIYFQIATEIGSQLLVSYTPDLVDKDGGFHKLAVKATREDVTVAAPEGYFAPGGGR